MKISQSRTLGTAGARLFTCQMPFPSGRSRIYKRGAKDEAPKAPRGVGCGDGCPLLTGGGTSPLPRPLPTIHYFGSQNGDFRCIVDTIIYSSAIWFKCKSVDARVKSSAKPAYWDYKPNIAGGYLAYSSKNKLKHCSILRKSVFDNFHNGD